MSKNDFDKEDVILLGAGCASLSLAARANELLDYEFTVIDTEIYPTQNHIWGFWRMPWLSNTELISRKTWYKWKIISANKSITHSTKVFPYTAINRNDWMNDCKKKAFTNDVKFKDKYSKRHKSQIIDSRPPKIPNNNMLQHFVGYEVQTDKDVFDDTTAILMDFRCDQSLGMHFIYCLPFSKRQALVESTLFSPKKAPPKFYDNAIKKYLDEIISINNFTILRKEKGTIPLGIFEKRNPSYDGIGGNGGAIRPSSGYAFGFIQKQVDKIITSSQKTKKLKVSSPHTKFELIMDRIFIKVLRINPLIAPQIFAAMAKNLSGDEFAKFLSGEANIRLWLKVIFVMPKVPFMKAVLEIIKGTNPKW